MQYPKIVAFIRWLAHSNADRQRLYSLILLQRFPKVLLKLQWQYLPFK